MTLGTWEEFLSEEMTPELAERLRLMRAAQWSFDACPMLYKFEGDCVARVNGLTHPSGVNV